MSIDPLIGSIEVLCFGRGWLQGNFREPDMDHQSHSHTHYRQVLIVALALLLAGCLTSSPPHSSTYLLKTNAAGVEDISARIGPVLLAKLQETGSFQEGYPLYGQYVTEEDPAHAGGQLARCSGKDEPNAQEGCILLNQGGDFIRISPVTWQSAAFHMYRLYVVPRGLFVSVDPTKDYVALDIFAQAEPDSWPVVQEAIEQAVGATGARPFQP
jgi:hypothetical protein